MPRMSRALTASPPPPMNTSPRDVLIFWDYENCRPASSSSGLNVADSIRHIAHKYGPVKSFKAYLEITDGSILNSSKMISLRSQLQSSGVSLIDCPHNGSKNVADIMMIVDMMAAALDWAVDTTAFLVITEDRDFTYALAMLRLRGYHVVLIHKDQASVGLRSRATDCYDWNADVLERCSPNDSCGTSTDLTKGRPMSRRLSMAASYSHGPTKLQHEAAPSIPEQNPSTTAVSTCLTEWDLCKASVTSAHRASVSNVDRPKAFALASPPHISSASTRQTPSLFNNLMNRTEASCSSTPPPKHAPSLSQQLPSFTWGSGTPRFGRNEADGYSESGFESQATTAAESNPDGDGDVEEPQRSLPRDESETIQIHQPAPSAPAVFDDNPQQPLLSRETQESSEEAEPTPIASSVLKTIQVELPPPSSPAAPASSPPPLSRVTLLPSLSICAAIERASSVVSINTSSDPQSPATEAYTTALELSRPGIVVPDAPQNHHIRNSLDASPGDDALRKGKEKEDEPSLDTGDTVKPEDGFPLAQPRDLEPEANTLDGAPPKTSRIPAISQPSSTAPHGAFTFTFTNSASPPSSDLWLENARKRATVPFQPSAATLDALKQRSSTAPSPPSYLPEPPITPPGPLPSFLSSKPAPTFTLPPPINPDEPIPLGMAPLITILEKHAALGNPKPFLTTVQSTLSFLKPSILSLVDGLEFQDWPAYFAKAEVYQVAKIGDDSGLRCISLNEAWKTLYRDDRREHPLGSNGGQSNGGGSVSVPGMNVASSPSGTAGAACSGPSIGSLPAVTPPARSTATSQFLPEYFNPLIYSLETRQTNYALHQVPRYQVREDLERIGADVYQNDTVGGFMQYCAMAQQAGIVELGGTPGYPNHDWIRLLEWPPKSSEAPGHNRGGSEIHRPTHTFGTTSVIALPSSEIPQHTYTVGTTSVAPLPSSATLRHTYNLRSSSFIAPQPVPVSTSSPRKNSQEQFKPLITVLRDFRSKGITKPTRDDVGAALQKRPGAKKLRKYLTPAENAGLIVSGGKGMKSWVSLGPVTL